MKRTIVAIIIGVLVLAGALYFYYKHKPAGPQPKIAITSPNGGEVIAEGSTYTIAWSTQDVPDANKVSITIRRIPPPALQEEGQEFDPLVATDLPDTGRYDWQVSDMYPEGNYILGITSYANTPVTDPLTDESDADFRLVKNQTNRSYTNDKFGYSVSYPNDWTYREFPETRTGAGFRPSTSPDDIASECVTVDERGTAANELDAPFADYVKQAAIIEIQGYEKLNSIKPVTAQSGLTGYETTWIYKDVAGQTQTSLPITYFENQRTDGSLTFKTVQIILNNQDCQAVYEQMIASFAIAGN